MITTVVGTDAAGISTSVACVRKGGILLKPTETVYGLGGDAADAGVALSIRELKRSSADKALLVLTDEWARVYAWFGDRSTSILRLMNHPERLPITLLVAASDAAPTHLIGREGLVGVRRTSDVFCRAIIEVTDTPLLSTSANLAGDPSPALFGDVNAEILRGVDLAVDAGHLLLGVPSTIVRVDGDSIQIVRDGSVDAETIHAIIG